jgi:hypothetical protein
MSTGMAADVFGPNEFDNAITNGLNDIPELTNAVPSSCGTIADGLFLSFDFVPQSSNIRFKYVFASDEYNAFVCTQYNDAFAFLISGPGIAGEQNMALTPSGDPITISTINDGTNTGTPTGDVPCVLTNNALFNMLVNPNNPANMSVQYNGFTNILTASASGLIPCLTYTLKLMIADYCDGVLSSGVFLAANSFSSGPDLCTITKNFSVQNALDSGILVYPNPTAGQFTISLDNTAVRDYVIFDQLGRLVKTGLLSGPKTNICLDVESGIYCLMVGEHVAKLQVIN